MWPTLPLEFNVIGTPVSHQSQNARARDQWKQTVLAAARSAIAAQIGNEHQAWAFADHRLSVTMFYFPQDRMAGDIDNIIKLTLDALRPHVMLDDGLVDRLVVQRFEQSSTDFSFANPSEALVQALAMDQPVLHIRLADVSLEGVVA